jgi:hypothetical protein
MAGFAKESLDTTIVRSRFEPNVKRFKLAS